METEVLVAGLVGVLIVFRLLDPVVQRLLSADELKR